MIQRLSPQQRISYVNIDNLAACKGSTSTGYAISQPQMPLNTDRESYAICDLVQLTESLPDATNYPIAIEISAEWCSLLFFKMYVSYLLK